MVEEAIALDELNSWRCILLEILLGSVLICLISLFQKLPEAGRHFDQGCVVSEEGTFIQLRIHTFLKQFIQTRLRRIAIMTRKPG